MGARAADPVVLPPDRRPGVRLLVVAGLLLLVLIGAGAYLAQQQHDKERALVAESLQSEADVAAARVEQFFAERYESLTTIARSPIVRTGDPATIKAWFEELVAAGSSFTGGLSLIDTDGRMVLLSGFPLDEPPVDLSDRDYVQGVLRTGRPVSGDAIVGRRSGDPLLTFAVPVPGGDAPLEAILAGTIRLDLPSGGFARLGTSLANVVLIDGAGHVVLDRGAIADLRTAHPDFVAALRAGGEPPESLADPNGTPDWAGAIARVGDTSWWAVVLRPSDTVWGPVEETRELQLAALFLLGVIGMGAAWIVGRGLDRTAAADRRRVEAAAERERFLREFTDALPVAAGVLDAELRPITANRSFRALGGTDLRGLVHQEDIALLPTADRVEALSVDVRILDRSAPDGVRWHRVSFAPETATEEARWFFAAVDVDREKRAELGLRRDIAERDEFLGLVSHELRTPLTVVVGTALTLLRGRASLAPEVADGLDDIHESARRLQRLLENMLVLSRMETDGLRDDAEPQVLMRLVERTLEDFRRLAPDREIRLSVPEDVPIVLANTTHVDQVLWNLLTNAVKYGDPGTPIDLTISAEADHVAVAVSDRGPGIPPGEQDAIFEAHYRTASGRSAAGGLGLGLSVCRRLVELQGGTITVTSRPGGGSTFTFTLPSVVDEHEPTAGAVLPRR